MACLSIARSAVAPHRRSEHRLADHRLVRHFAAERREAVKIVARLPARGGAQRRIEIAYAVEPHLREQKGLARPPSPLSTSSRPADGDTAAIYHKRIFRA